MLLLFSPRRLVTFVGCFTSILGNPNSIVISSVLTSVCNICLVLMFIVTELGHFNGKANPVLVSLLVVSAVNPWRMSEAMLMLSAAISYLSRELDASTLLPTKAWTFLVARPARFHSTHVGSLFLESAARVFCMCMSRERSQ